MTDIKDDTTKVLLSILKLGYFQNWFLVIFEYRYIESDLPHPGVPNWTFEKVENCQPISCPQSSSSAVDYQWQFNSHWHDTKQVHALSHLQDITLGSHPIEENRIAKVNVTKVDPKNALKNAFLFLCSKTFLWALENGLLCKISRQCDTQL